MQSVVGMYSPSSIRIRHRLQFMDLKTLPPRPMLYLYGSTHKPQLHITSGSLLALQVGAGYSTLISAMAERYQMGSPVLSLL